MEATDVVIAIACLLAGGVFGWLVASRRGGLQLGALEAAAAADRARLEVLGSQAEGMEAALATARSRINELSADLATAEAGRTFAETRADSEEQRWAAAQEKMRLEFEQLAARLLEEKSSKFLDLNQQSLGALLQPLRERIGEFRERIEAIHSEESKSAATLGGQLKVLQDLNLRMADEAAQLVSALKGQSKSQGSWGELVLEKILEKSGLRKGVEYDTQTSLRDEEGSRRMPDVIIRLPEGRHLIVDAKVSLTAYERSVNAPSDALRTAALREHATSVRRHVEELSRKDYPGLEGLESPDFVLMFVPVEPALNTALEHDPSLYGDAFASNVVLVSSSTLLVALRAVESVWRRHKQTLNAQEIARRAGKLHDAFVLFVSSLEEIGNRLDQARASYDTAMNRLVSGKGNLVRRTVELEKLGARTEKQLPPDLLRRLEEAPAEE